MYKTRLYTKKRYNTVSLLAAPSPKRSAAGTKRSNSGKATTDKSSGGGAEGGAKPQKTAKGAAAQLPTLGEMTIEHNIPHKYVRCKRHKSIGNYDLVS